MKHLTKVVMAFVLGVATLSAPAFAQTVGIGTTAQGSITYSVGAAIAKAVAEKTGIQARVQPGGGQNVALPAVDAGEVEFGIANEQQYYEAAQGVGAFDNGKLGNLQAVSVLMPLRVAMFVKLDSPIKTIADLKGKRVPSEFKAQEALGQIVSGLLANAGLSWDDVSPVPVTNVIQGAQDFSAGQTDVMFFAVGAAKVQEIGSSLGGLRVLPIDPSDAAMERFRKEFPVAYAVEVQPSQSLYGVIDPTQMTAFDQLLVVNNSVSEDTVYAITKAMHDSKASFTESFKPFGMQFDPDRMSKKIPVGSYHPGAVKYFKEAGIWHDQ